MLFHLFEDACYIFPRQTSNSYLRQRYYQPGIAGICVH